MMWSPARTRERLGADMVDALYAGLLGREASAEERSVCVPMTFDRDRLESLVGTLARSDEAAARLRTGPRMFVPPGHFYSPITEPAEIEGSGFADTAPAPRDLPGVKIDGERMRTLWADGAAFLKECEFTEGGREGRLYRFANGAFGHGDAITYYLMLRTFQPRRLVEIGAGYSSACSLDTLAAHSPHPVDVTFIDPFPQLLLSIVGEPSAGRFKVIEQPVQAVDPSVFDALGANDILFIDSTHVVKTGSDVVHELFHILPHLADGVVVHFHDIFYPFEYPRGWAVEENRSWNEAYALRAFLMFNRDFEVVFFNDYFAKHYRSEVEALRPDFLMNPGGSLWLRKRGPALPRPTFVA